MTVIVCLDNANGMMFNHRRQSRDANVVKDILKTINGASVGLSNILDRELDRRKPTERSHR